MVAQRTRILDNDGGSGAPSPFVAGDRLLRRPAVSGFVDVQATAGRVSAFFRTDARGNTRDIDPSFGAGAGIFTNPGFTTVDAGVSIRLPGGVDVFGRALNLFDRSYEEIFGFPALGRSAMVGVRIAAGH